MFSIFFPAIVIGLGFAPPVFNNVQVYIIESTITSTPFFQVIYTITNQLKVIVSLSVSSILAVLMLFKYIRTRRLIARASRKGGGWASGGSTEGGWSGQDNGPEGMMKSGATSTYDIGLLTRFTIGFVFTAYVCLGSIGKKLIDEQYLRDLYHCLHLVPAAK